MKTVAGSKMNGGPEECDKWIEEAKARTKARVEEKSKTTKAHEAE